MKLVFEWQQIDNSKTNLDALLNETCSLMKMMKFYSS